MEQLSDNPQDLLAAPGQISGLGIARKDNDTPKIQLMDRRFPGRCGIHLTIEEAQQLATVLRRMSQGSQDNEPIGPIRVGFSFFNTPHRRQVVTIFVNDFPGEMRIYISEADAQRIADELEQSIQRAQAM